jgi:putative effector of murein hydrolase LrgA (UPF0299 family)
MEIYYPYRKVNRFTTKRLYLRAYLFFVPSSVGIITKSYKDVLAYSTFNVSAISVPSETYLMKPEKSLT